MNHAINTSFNYIKSNIYSVRVPVEEMYECYCKQRCGIGCINRLLFEECTPELCKLGKSCTNDKIQNGKTAAIELFQTINKGIGVKAEQFIQKNSFVEEYVGEIVLLSKFKKRLKTQYNQDLHHFGMLLGDRFVIDSYRMGNMARFVNHSCQPNCDMQKWKVNGKFRMCLFSKIDIQKGTEITFNYKFKRYGEDKSVQTCFCGVPSCNGAI